MAKIVDAPDWSSFASTRAIRPAGTSIYPYAEWFNGQAWELTLGEGGDIPKAKPSSWANSAKAIASKKYGMSLKTHLNADGTLVIQAFPKPVAAPAQDDLPAA